MWLFWLGFIAGASGTLLCVLMWALCVMASETEHAILGDDR